MLDTEQSHVVEINELYLFHRIFFNLAKFCGTRLLSPTLQIR